MSIGASSGTVWGMVGEPLEKTRLSAKDGMYLATESLRCSLPCSTSDMAATVVIGLVME